ncbi:PAS domain S-box protein [Phycicoccus sp.]|uniref:sensor histidine kinase n=1 Tax=Phycicoccus sp. TaxID=1902410 RepID=UPI002CAB315F|nr:PAS domain S-box protein [Phycicoccus sp.]HMM94716.1 PAS domain S-box protein [Phycicoccus sp.]
MVSPHPATRHRWSGPGPIEPADVELAVLDRDGVVVAVNDAWERFREANGGSSAACGPGASYLAACEVAGDGVSGQVAAVLRGLCAGERSAPVTFTIPCDGPASGRWFDLVLSPRPDDAGHSVGCVVTLTPVAAPARVPRATVEDLTVLEDPLVREILERAPDATLLVAEDGSVAYLNHRLEEISGYSRAQLLGESFDLLVPLSVRDRHRTWERAFRNAPRVRVMAEGGDAALRRADGAEVPVEIALSSVEAEGHRLVLASLRDTTRQRAEDRARRRLLQMLDMVSESVFVVDASSGRIEYASSGASQLLGRTREQLCAVSLYDISPSASRARARSVLAEHEREGPGHVHALEVVRRAADGTDIPCDSWGRLVVTETGERKFLVVERDARPRLTAERRSGQRVELAELVTDLMGLALSGTSLADLHSALVAGVAQLLDSENASLVVHDPRAHRFTTLAAVGPAATTHLRGRVRLDADTLGEWVRAGVPRRLADPPPTMPPALRRRVGPGLVVPFHDPSGLTGLLTTFRAAGRAPFEAADEDLLVDLSRDMTMVLTLGQNRIHHERLALLEERQRISRDLHDTVLQDVIALGMMAARPSDDDPDPTRPGIARDELLERLEAVVRDLRLIAFEARPEDDATSFTRGVAHTVAEVGRVLGHQPLLATEGDLEGLPVEVRRQVLPVLREALSNVARHARARSTTVTLRVAADRLTLVVADDGRGFAVTAPGGSGLETMSARATSLGGSSTCTSAPGRATELVWSVPLPGSGPGSGRS